MENLKKNDIVKEGKRYLLMYNWHCKINYFEKKAPQTYKY